MQCKSAFTHVMIYKCQSKQFRIILDGTKAGDLLDNKTPIVYFQYFNAYNAGNHRYPPRDMHGVGVGRIDGNT